MSATERKEKLRDLHQMLNQKTAQLFEMIVVNAELIEENRRLRSLVQDTICAICGKQMLDHDEPCEEPC